VLASSALLNLADGRFPAGGHAHSGGLEEAAASGRVANAPDLAGFLAGQLQTIGRVDAALAALSCWVSPAMDDLSALQAEAIARSPSPAQRLASRSKGRGLLRAAAAIWPLGAVAWMAQLSHHVPGGPMYPVALGSVAAAVGLGPLEAALVAAQGSITAPAWGRDPAARRRPICSRPLPGRVGPGRRASGPRGRCSRLFAHSGRGCCRAARLLGGACRDWGRNPRHMGGTSLCLLKPTCIPRACTRYPQGRFGWASVARSAAARPPWSPPFAVHSPRAGRWRW